jgi:hypothetical protein
MLLILVTMLIQFPLFAQEKVVQDKKEVTLSEVEGLKISNKLKDLQLLEMQIQLLQSQYTKVKGEAESLVEQVYVSNKLDRKEWDLDLQTMKFVRKPTDKK